VASRGPTSKEKEVPPVIKELSKPKSPTPKEPTKTVVETPKVTQVVINKMLPDLDLKSPKGPSSSQKESDSTTFDKNKRLDQIVQE
jgi:hypothetical protein